MVAHPAPPAPTEPATRLTLGFALADRLCRLDMAGVLDALSVGALDVVIDQLACASFDRVVIDATGLRVIDDVGVNILVGLHHYVRAHGATMAVIGARAPVAAALPAALCAADPDRLRRPAAVPSAASALAGISRATA